MLSGRHSPGRRSHLAQLRTRPSLIFQIELPDKPLEKLTVMIDRGFECVRISVGVAKVDLGQAIAETWFFGCLLCRLAENIDNVLRRVLRYSEAAPGAD